MRDPVFMTGSECCHECVLISNGYNLVNLISVRVRPGKRRRPGMRSEEIIEVEGGSGCVSNVVK